MIPVAYRQSVSQMRDRMRRSNAGWVDEAALQRYAEERSKLMKAVRSIATAEKGGNITDEIERQKAILAKMKAPGGCRGCGMTKDLIKKQARYINELEKNAEA